MTDLKPGQELTYEQVMALPDGARFTIFWGNEPDFYSITVNRAAPSNLTFAGFSVYLLDRWSKRGWHSAILVSLPKDSQEIISEKLSQSAAEQAPAQPEPYPVQAAYNKLMQPEPTIKDLTSPARELAKRAALALIKTLRDDVDRSTGNATDYGVYVSCTAYVEAYDYAKSIGAIE